MAVVKIVDVAQAAQVSAATVSRALNHSSRVDPVLAGAGLATAERLGYRPNAVARNLRRQGTQVWALIITDINNPFYTAVARGVEDQASESGFSVLLCNTDEDQSKEDRYLEVAAQERVAGVILAPRASDSDVSGPAEQQDPLGRRGPPARPAGGLRHRRLLRGSGDGHRAPAPAGLAATRLRDPARRHRDHRGTPVAVRGRDAPARPPATVRHVPFHTDSGLKVIDELFGSGEAPDSLVTVDSMLTLGVMTGLKRRRLKIGRDVGLIGFDEAVWAWPSSLRSR